MRLVFPVAHDQEAKAAALGGGGGDIGGNDVVVEDFVPRR